MGYPKMEKMPKGVMSSDMTGDKKVKVPKEDKEVFKTCLLYTSPSPRDS